MTHGPATSPDAPSTLGGLGPGPLREADGAHLTRRIPVELGEQRYDVVVGPGARFELPELLPRSAERAAFITQEGIPARIEAGVPSFTVEIPRGETAKSLATIELCCRRFAEEELSRSDVVIGLGGGLVTDVAGLAAALWHRGTAVVQVATTLLAQIDAAVGGKTGVNLPDGKNLVGAFWQPSGVICDTEMLSSLPEQEWRSGCGELAKYELLGVEGLRDASLVDKIARCVAYKAGIVAADEREKGLRMVLNYGHTLAHALEAAGFATDAAEAADAADAARDDEVAGEVRAITGSKPLRHGEAVGIGLVFAARLARAEHRIDEARLRQHEEVVSAYGLPSR
ncbi:MAG: 3-dehydroquinate synthase family protein, partial [Acidimicrobiales bacterium]